MWSPSLLSHQKPIPPTIEKTAWNNTSQQPKGLLETILRNSRKDRLKQYFTTAEMTAWNNTSLHPKWPVETILRNSRKECLKQYFAATEKTGWNNTSQQPKRPVETILRINRKDHLKFSDTKLSRSHTGTLHSILFFSKFTWLSCDHLPTHQHKILRKSGLEEDRHCKTSSILSKADLESTVRSCVSQGYRTLPPLGLTAKLTGSPSSASNGHI